MCTGQIKNSGPSGRVSPGCDFPKCCFFKCYLWVKNRSTLVQFKRLATVGLRFADPRKGMRPARQIATRPDPRFWLLAMVITSTFSGCRVCWKCLNEHELRWTTVKNVSYKIWFRSHKCDFFKTSGRAGSRFSNPCTSPMSRSKRDYRGTHLLLNLELRKDAIHFLKTPKTSKKRNRKANSKTREGVSFFRF